MKVGVLAVQGDVEEHQKALTKINVQSRSVKDESSIKAVDALIIPGGESTTISKLIQHHGLADCIKEFAKQKKPLIGTCAGMVLLAREGDDQVRKTRQNLLGLIDAKVNRNAFGSQRESFEEKIEIPVLGGNPYPCVFIRAPAYEKTGANVEVLATYQGKIIAAREGKVGVTSFHPELSGDPRLLKHLLEG
ncbi:MAG: pyridoxal 5'-phosphate synthase glutaminase subunit PdxT [Candidatus Altiarchaeales archaeon]|nr:pyridoxal 5'-phosphate synthase glutaminase subunit PdxT [Candidatus Altiarchaeales archaeon]